MCTTNTQNLRGARLARYGVSTLPIYVPQMRPEAGTPQNLAFWSPGVPKIQILFALFLYVAFSTLCTTMHWAGISRDCSPLASTLNFFLT